MDYIRKGVVTGLETDYVSGGIGKELSSGILDKPVIFYSHGTRPCRIAGGESHIDVAFLAAPTSDDMGNCTGKCGPSACGSLGYAMADAMYADKTVIITDNLVPYPCRQPVSYTHLDVYKRQGLLLWQEEKSSPYTK